MIARRWVALTLAAGVGTITVPVPAEPVFAGKASSNCTTAKGVYGEMPWAQTRLGIEQTRPLSMGVGVTVAIVATGVDPGRGRFLDGQVVNGGDVRSGGSTALTDCDGTGTFAASLVAAQPVQGTRFAGVAPGAKILAIRYTEARADNQQVSGDAENLALGIQTATDAGARVIVVVTARPIDSAKLRKAVSNAMAADAVVVSAGKVSQQQNITYPTAYPGVLGVTGVTPDGALLTTSEHGSEISLAAPGSGLVGSAPGSAEQTVPLDNPGMAAAFVGGAAALLRAYRPQLKGPEVIRQLRATATPMAQPGLGDGMVNPFAALTISGPASASRGDTHGAMVVLPAVVTPALSPRLWRGRVVAGVLAGTAALITIGALLRPALGRRKRSAREQQLSGEST